MSGSTAAKIIIWPLLVIADLFKIIMFVISFMVGIILIITNVIIRVTSNLFMTSIDRLLKIVNATAADQCRAIRLYKEKTEFMSYFKLHH